MQAEKDATIHAQELEALIFDLDGTLWDGADTIAAAWNQGLREFGMEPWLTRETLGRSMGMTVEQLRQHYFGEFPQEEGQAMLERCFAIENALVEKTGGFLFPEVRETLADLSGKYKLMIVSNCGCGYIEAFLAHYGLAPLFQDIESNGGTGLPKGDNIRLIMERNQIRKAAYIGDTLSDYEAAGTAAVPFIHAAYGFGTVPKELCSMVLQRFADLRVFADGHCV